MSKKNKIKFYDVKRKIALEKADKFSCLPEGYEELTSGNLTIDTLKQFLKEKKNHEKIILYFPLAIQNGSKVSLEEYKEIVREIYKSCDAEEDINLIYVLALNPWTDEDILLDIAEKFKDKDNLFYSVFMHREISEPMAKFLENYQKDDELKNDMKYILAKSFYVSAEILHKYLETDDIQMLKLISIHRNSSEETSKLAKEKLEKEINKLSKGFYHVGNSLPPLWH